VAGIQLEICQKHMIVLQVLSWII